VLEQAVTESTYILTRSSPSKEHVRGDLAQEVTDEEDRDTGLVLATGQAEILFEFIQAGKCDGIAIKVVEPVHAPQHRL
jgi:hypothetical protein